MEGSAARCSIDIEFYAENYDLAWEILSNTFENKNLLVHNYMSTLVSRRLSLSFERLLDTVLILKQEI